jgi:hypothetical protein
MWRHITEAEHQLLHRWRREGVPILECAARLSVSKSTVLRHLRTSVFRKFVPSGTNTAVRRRIRDRRKLVVKLANQMATRCVRAGKTERSAAVIVRRRCFPSCRSIAREVTIVTGTLVSSSTVRRDLLASGYIARVRPRGPRRRVGDEECRVRFAKTQLDLLRRYPGHINNLLFTDEKICDVNEHGGRYEWNPEGTPASHRQYEKFAPKLHVHGIIGVGIKKLTVLSSGNVDQTVYIRVLTKHKALLQRKVLQQDGARPHVGARTTAWLRRNRIRTMDWPARSPDMNPLETVWSFIQHRVDRCGPASRSELEQFWRQEWNSIPQSVIDQTVRSYERRLREVVKQEGRTIRVPRSQKPPYQGAK